MPLHPSAVLHTAAQAPRLAVVDHYCGTETKIRKALALQAELAQRFKTKVMDVTLDLEDGAPVGGELEHAQMVAEIAAQHFQSTGLKAAVRIHPTDHPAFAQDIKTLLQAANAISHMMIPKVESLADITAAAQLIPAQTPLHALIESASAVSNAASIAAHPRVASLSFGLMDFVSSHNGAISASAMTLATNGGQFDHPLVLQAKLAIATACHAHAKVPSHCVVTEFKDITALKHAASTAAKRLGYTRMWSIHPAQVLPILEAFAPDTTEVNDACAILLAGSRADWAPIAYQNTLHDRASYRYYWQLLQQAQATGSVLPREVTELFF